MDESLQQKGFVKLDKWSIVSSMDRDAPFCRPEETDLNHIHLKGVSGSLVYNGDSVVELKGTTIIITKITTRIRDAEEIEGDNGEKLKVFVTCGHGYILGEPNPEFVKVWGCGLKATDSLFEIIKKKKMVN